MPSAVPGQVSGGLEQLRLGDVRGVDELVARLHVTAPRVVLQLTADDAALGMEDGQAGADLVGEREEVELGAQATVVAPFGLGQALQMGVERLLRLPRGAVDALQLRVLLAAPPVRRRAAGELHGRDVLRGGQMRAATEVGPDGVTRVGVHVVVDRQLAGGVDLDRVFRRRALEIDELQLVGLVGKLLAGVLDRVEASPGEALPRLDDLLHRGLEGGEVVGGERGVDVEVVVEAVGDGRADAELRVGSQLLHGLGEDVGGGVADDAAAVLGVGGDGLDVDVYGRGPREVAQCAVGADDDHRLRPARREARGAYGGTGRRPGLHPDGGRRWRRCWRGHGDLRRRRAERLDARGCPPRAVDRESRSVNGPPRRGRAAEPKGAPGPGAGRAGSPSRPRWARGPSDLRRGRRRPARRAAAESGARSLWPSSGRVRVATARRTAAVRAPDRATAGRTRPAGPAPPASSRTRLPIVPESTRSNAGRSTASADSIAPLCPKAGLPI